MLLELGLILLRVGQVERVQADLFVFRMKNSQLPFFDHAFTCMHCARARPPNRPAGNPLRDCWTDSCCATAGILYVGILLNTMYWNSL